jgi:hypothetical protein
MLRRLVFSSLLLPAILPSLASAQIPKAPPALAESAWAHLNRYVGEAFVRYYISKDSAEDYREPQDYPKEFLQRPTRPGVLLVRAWRFSYHLQIHERPWVNAHFSVTVGLDGGLTPRFDEAGRFIQEGGIDGIGNCAQDSTLCQFPIDRDAAIHIAKENGLEEGLAPWHVGFNWYHSEDGRFIWAVSNTLRIGQDKCSNSGKDILIDANTGKIYQRTGWSRVCDHF